MCNFIGLLVMLCLGCQPIENPPDASINKKVEIDKKDPLPAVYHNRENSLKNEIQNIKRAFFGRMNWIDFDIMHTFATIRGRSFEFQKDASLNITPAGAKSITNLEEFKDICQEKSYETNNILSGMQGQALIYVNPLHWSIATKIAFNRLNELVTKVENPYTILHKKMEVDAEFLSSAERDSIVNSFIPYNFDNLDILRINLFNPLVAPDQELSSTLTRLFCGIADHKASILYTFHDEKGEEMRVRINGVVFDDLVY